MHALGRRVRRGVRRPAALAVALLAAAAALTAPAAEAALGGAPTFGSLCGNAGPAPSAPKHVVVVMMENHDYNEVVGSPNAPFQSSLADQCGVGTSAFGATH